jgi:uncharacterized protein YkwD
MARPPRSCLPRPFRDLPHAEAGTHVPRVEAFTLQFTVAMRSVLQRLVVAAAAGLLAIGCVSPTAPGAVPAPSLSLSAAPAVSSSVLDLTNAERSRAGLAPVRGNSRLVQAAQLQADQLVSANRLEHVLSGAPYPAPADRLAAAGYDWLAYGENIAMGHRGAVEVVSAWMQSPGHRDNILDARYTELGVGFAIDRSGRPYYAQVFGRPAS